MSLARFKSYNPAEKLYSRRRTEEEWEPYHLLLTEMHAQRYTRREMLTKLKEIGFDVSPGQLLSQMKKWDMMVYGEHVSHSGAHQPSSDENTNERAPELLILNDSPLNEPLHLEEKPIFDDLPTIPPLSFVGTVSHIRQFSGHQSFDDVSDAISFSTLDDAQDILVDQSFRDLRETADSSAYTRPFSFVEPVMHALGSDAADPSSILRQMSTITEPWCGNFPTTCCCQELFRGQGGFRGSPELYKIILEQSSPHSLKYIVALLNLVETKSLGEDTQELRVHFWDTVNYYLQLCTRINLKNKLAPHILHRLLKVWEAFSDGDRLPFPTTDLFRSSAANTHESLINKILRTRPSTNTEPALPDYQVEWQIDAERDVGCVVGFTVHQPSTFPLLNCAGEVFGSTKSRENFKDTIESPRPITELILTANQIAAYMQSQWHNGTSITTAHDLGDCDVPLIFTALGLMIALETTTSTSEVDLTNPKSWRPGLQAFIETTVNTLSLNADYADKFRKAYWLVRCENIGHKGKTIHMGAPCTATLAWKTLERSIHDFDEERTWFERRFFSGRNNSWPQANDLLSSTDDNMSIRSGNSFNSFRRFQALALHLKIGTPASGSLKTKSSSRQSRRSSLSHMSWQLEQMLQIHDDGDQRGGGGGGDHDGDVGDGPDVEQRTRMDETAFEKMQAIVE